MNYSIVRLIKEFRTGNRNAFEEIYNRHHLQLYYFARKLTGNPEVAAEIVSDTFVRLWTLRAGFTTLERIKSFLYLTARNACLDYLRTDQSTFEQNIIEAELLYAHSNNQ